MGGILGFCGGLVGKSMVAGRHAIDVAGFVECRCSAGFSIVPCMVNNRATFLLVPCKFHAPAVESGFGAKKYHHCLQDRDASVERKGLAILLLAHVDSKREGWFNAGDELSHVVIDVRLQNGCIGGSDVGEEIPLGDCIVTFG